MKCVRCFRPDRVNPSASWEKSSTIITEVSTVKVVLATTPFLSPDLGFCLAAMKHPLYYGVVHPTTTFRKMCDDSPRPRSVIRRKCASGT